jgi:hypothetical protein
MGTLVVYSSILSAVMASIRTIRPKPIIFDTAVGDLTDQLSEPSGALQGRPTGKATLVRHLLSARHCAMSILGYLGRFYDVSKLHSSRAGIYAYSSARTNNGVIDSRRPVPRCLGREAWNRGPNQGGALPARRQAGPSAVRSS